MLDGLNPINVLPRASRWNGRVLVELDRQMIIDPSIENPQNVYKLDDRHDSPAAYCVRLFAQRDGIPNLRAVQLLHRDQR